MGQLQDKIEEQIKNKAQYHLKYFNELIKTVRDLDKQGLWPFDKISAKQFLLTAEPFLDAMMDIYKADAIRFAGVAIPALKDQTASASIELTKCIHELELETIIQDLAEGAYKSDISVKLNNMTAILEWSQKVLYANNSEAIALLEPVANENDRTPLLLSQEDAFEFTPWQAVLMTDYIIEAHKTAFKGVLDDATNLINHGTPSDTITGKLIDKLRHLEDVKQQNAVNAIELANREIDIEYLNTFVCHSLKRNLVSIIALMAAEQEHPDGSLYDLNELKEDANRYAYTLKYIETSLQEMREQEKAMSAETTLTVKRVGDGTFAVTIHQPDNANIDTDVTGKDFEYLKTLYRNYMDDSRIVKVGKKSSAVKMDIHKIHGIFRGHKVEINATSPTKENEKVKSLKERIYGECSYAKTRSMKARGARSTRLKLQTNAMRFKDKKIRIKQVHKKNKETELVNNDIKVLSATISTKGVDTGVIGTPTISAEGKIVDAQIGSHGVSVNASAGAQIHVGAQISSKDIAKLIAKILAGELINGNQGVDFKAVVDKLTSLLRNIPPEVNTNWGNITISAQGIELLKLQVDEQEQEQIPTINLTSPIQQEIEGLKEDAEQALNDLEQIYQKLNNQTPQQEIDETIETISFDDGPTRV